MANLAVDILAILCMIAGLSYRDAILCVGLRQLFNRRDDSMSSLFASVLID
jgi:hypothetical protein